MYVDKKLILQPIIDLLSLGIPLKAFQIAKILRKELKIYELQKTDVNMVLYGDLRGVAERDKNFYWSIRKGLRTSGQITAMPRQAKDTDPVLPPSDLDVAKGISVRGSLLRTIERLRCGLPPLEHVDQLTVGPERNVLVAKELLAGKMKRRWLMVEGAYGHGKSHYLALIRDLASRLGIATCHLCADGSGAALNHPQRFLPILLSTMVVPGKNPRGYVHLVYEMLQDPEQAGKLSEIVDRYFRPGTRRRPEVETRELLSGLLYLSSRRNDEEVMAQITHVSNRIAYHLSGESVRYRQATPDTRHMVYGLLCIARDVAIARGGKGLAILVDEAESIYTKLHNLQSRRGAYRVLAQLCDASELSGCTIAVALTPDARRNLEFELPEMMSDIYATEPVRLWASGLSGGEVETIRCRPLRIGDREQIISRLLKLYWKTYPNSVHNNNDPRRWEAFVSNLISKEMPVRLLIRQAVDYLDCSRYYPLSH